MHRGADTPNARLVPIVGALPVLPRPALLGFFLVAIVVGERAERGEMLGALIGKPAERVLTVERAPGDAEICGAKSTDAEIQRGLCLVPGLLRQRVPLLIEMGEQHRASVDRDVMPEL